MKFLTHCIFQIAQKSALHFFVTFLVLLPYQGSLACSAFSYHTNNGKVILAKNYDWMLFHGHGAIFKSPRNTERMAFNLDQEGEPLKWKSKWGNLTFTQFGIGFPIGGINEKGLVIELLELDETKYNSHQQTLPQLNESQWAQYQLDRYQSTQEVIANLHKFRISKAFIGIHYFLSDAEGNSAVIEFLDGVPKAYYKETLPISGLTNSPYEKVVQISRHIAEKPLPGVWFERTSEKRFQTITSQLQPGSSRQTPPRAPSDAFQILDTVALNGTAKDAKFEVTQWSIVYNISDASVTFKSRNRPELRTVALRKLDFQTANTPQVFDLDSNLQGDVSSYFLPATREFNTQLVEKNRALIWIKWVLGEGWYDLDLHQKLENNFLVGSTGIEPATPTVSR